MRAFDDTITTLNGFTEQPGIPEIIEQLESLQNYQQQNQTPAIETIAKLRENLQNKFEDSQNESIAQNGLVLNDAIHQALVMLTRHYPFNNYDENGNIVDPIQFNSIESQNVITLTEGYQYDINSLIAWFKSSEEYRYPFTGKPLNQRDRELIKQFCQTKAINLEL